MAVAAAVYSVADFLTLVLSGLGTPSPDRSHSAGRSPGCECPYGGDACTPGLQSALAYRSVTRSGEHSIDPWNSLRTSDTPPLQHLWDERKISTIIVIMNKFLAARWCSG